MLRRVGLILATALLTFLIFQGRTAAQSASNLQADIFQLRSQINQLRAQVAELSRQSPSSSKLPSTASGRVRRSPADPTDPQIIDRLAELAIEAKERLNTLESRVSKLEKR